jgi:S1-C subfamily serine protease
MVARVEAGYGQTMGLRPGDFIRQINGQKINTTADLAAALKAETRVWTISIERGGQLITGRFSA